MWKYTPDSPCRCGYDGTGTHQCHAGRANDRCPNPANEYMVPRISGLAGMQLKFGVALAYYCESCAKEAGLAK